MATVQPKEPEKQEQSEKPDESEKVRRLRRIKCVAQKKTTETEFGKKLNQDPI